MAELTHSIQGSLTFEESEQLVVRLREREEAAFAEAFHLYRDMVYTLSRKLLANRAEAMDITQEVFFTLFKKIDSFRGECSLKTWLYRVTVNQAGNRNRWWKRRFRSRTLSLGLGADEQSNGYAQELCSREPLPDREYLSSELRQALEDGLKGLPFEQRAAVALRDVEGLTYEEIAQITGVHLGTVKSRIARGRERLREALKTYQQGRVQ